MHIIIFKNYKNSKKTMKNIIVPFFTLLLMLGCGDSSPEDSLVGSWKTLAGYEVNITFNSNGTYEIESKGHPGANNGKGKYELVKNPEGQGDYQYHIKLSEESWHLYWSGDAEKPIGRTNDSGGRLEFTDPIYFFCEKQ
jgi:hypothetical protein